MSSVQHKFLKQKSVGVVGVPFSGGQPRAGVDLGPLKIIEFGLLDQLKELNWQVKFDGHRDYTAMKPASDPPVGKLLNARHVSAVTESVAESVSTHLKEGSLALTLGGDHSIALELALESGNIHGCPISFLLGIAGQINEFSWVKPCLSLIALSILVFAMSMLARKRSYGSMALRLSQCTRLISMVSLRLFEMAIEHISPNLSHPIHLSFDVDALDPTVAPSTGTPVRGGLTFREGHYICEAIHETGCLVSMDLMEVNPSLEDDNAVFQTVTIGCSLVRCALGETLLLNH
ncbi:arginase [Lobosporangium transversale]|uniref:Arginase n=1 Tax=Lobosporangium transversale TaxID=64571 RepID=A0A1Y2GS84_9FUNG|nr:arginase [Lobosporangium transversale]ORZ19961.1 arginase [Lobosporangium transversale]|eukprot:XP_021882501.1 arginase [Lobosporangium transversale]